MSAPQSKDAVHPGSFSAWVTAIRPKTLPAAVAPVLVGTALAFRAEALHWGAALAAGLGALLLQIASNLANDVFDYEKGKDTSERLGPARAVATGLLTPKQVRIGLGVVFALCLLVGGYLVSRAGYPLVLVGVASMLSAVAYTAGPFPLGYHGLGDLFVFIFFGPIAVVGTTYAQTLSVTPEALLASVPLGLLTANILVVNNLRDYPEDSRTGKRTLVVRFGKSFAMWQAALSLIASYLLPIYYCCLKNGGWFMLLPWLSVPLAARWYRALRVTTGRTLNALLAQAAQLLLCYAVLFSISLVISR